jgi:methionyl aminopeptidase
MIPIKTKDEIKRMREGGKRLAWVLDLTLKRVKPGVSLKELDQLAESLIEKQKGKPSFKMVPNYHWATCININEGVVHGIPGSYQLKDGDLISLDVGIFYQGFHTDMARTVRLQDSGFGRVQDDNFLKAGKKALKEATKAARTSNHLGRISEAIEREIRKAGFSPVKALTGHGVGKKLHEEPQIPCFLEGEIKETPRLSSGMTLAIEVIYIQGESGVVLDQDGWTVNAANGKRAGLFEDTVLVTDKGGKVLTKLK